MRTFYTIIFFAAFFLPCLFIMYGVIFSIILFFSAINSGDYLRFFGVLFGTIGVGMGSFAAAQLLGLLLDSNTNIMRPVWIKLFLTIGLSSLVFTLINSPDNIDTPIVLLSLAPIPVVLHLMHLHRHYLWKNS